MKITFMSNGRITLECQGEFRDLNGHRAEKFLREMLRAAEACETDKQWHPILRRYWDEAAPGSQGEAER